MALLFVCSNLTGQKEKALCRVLRTFYEGLAGHFSCSQEGRKQEEPPSPRIPKHCPLYSAHGLFSCPGSVPLQLVPWALSSLSNNFLPRRNTNIVKLIVCWKPSDWGQQNLFWITCQIITNPVSIGTMKENKALEDSSAFDIACLPSEGHSLSVDYSALFYFLESVLILFHNRILGGNYLMRSQVQFFSVFWFLTFHRSHINQRNSVGERCFLGSISLPPLSLAVFQKGVLGCSLKSGLIMIPWKPLTKCQLQLKLISKFK